MLRTQQQTNQDEYNGWTNRETWLAGLWLTNDQFSYSLLLEAKKLDGNLRHKAEWLEEQAQELLCCPELEASLWSDLLNTAIARVDWVEVIEAQEED